MKISNQFEVKRPVDAVWNMFQDVPSVAQCLPGAELTEDKGEGSYAGKVSVKLGPMSSTFEGQATVTPDSSTKTGHIDGKGADKAGGSRGQVNVEYSLAASDGGTTVAVEADITLSGAIAQFGRTGLVEEMSKRLIDEFVECLEAKMAAETPAEAAEIKADEVKGISLFFSALGSLIAGFFKKLFKRGDKT
ncbi:MAG: SRPBCC family protein [Acidimicrobiia bacterium]|nr:SRPBCC family protein [Acidimicrobiia bacterium]MDH3471928.1 SRPBCC family protein [Acidimicrobiia bacterium]